MKIEPFVKEVSLDDEAAFITLPDGTRQRFARSIAEILHDRGGYEFDLPQADRPGNSVRISLLPWKNRDPETTYLIIGLTQHFSAEEAVRLGLKDEPREQ